MQVGIAALKDSILRDQRPCGSTFARRDFDLRMVPAFSQVETTYETDRFVPSGDHEYMARQFKLATAIRLVQKGHLSAGAACEFAEIYRYTLVASCEAHGILPVEYDPDELQRELDQFARTES